MGGPIASLFAKVGVDTKEFDRGMKNVKSELNLGAQAFKAMAAVVSVQTVRALADYTVELAKVAAEHRRLDSSFRQLSKAPDAMLAAMKKASSGTISETQMILAANRAMLLGISQDAEQLGKLMEVARFRGRAMGLSTQQAFSDIVTGLGRMSPLILDNLGITINAEATFADYAQSIGKAASALSDAEKKQALLNRVLSEGQNQIAAAGGIADDSADKFEEMGAKIDDMKVKLGELALNTGVIEIGVDFVTNGVEGINTAFEAMAAIDAWAAEHHTTTLEVLMFGSKAGNAYRGSDAGEKEPWEMTPEEWAAGQAGLSQYLANQPPAVPMPYNLQGGVPVSPGPYAPTVQKYLPNEMPELPIGREWGNPYGNMTPEQMRNAERKRLGMAMAVTVEDMIAASASDIADAYKMADAWQRMQDNNERKREGREGGGAYTNASSWSTEAQVEVAALANETQNKLDEATRRLEEEQTKSNQKIWDDYASKAKRAYDQILGFAEGAFKVPDDAIRAGLVGTDMQMGESWDENARRALDVGNLGEKSPWFQQFAGQFGGVMGNEEARKARAAQIAADIRESPTMGEIGPEGYQALVDNAKKQIMDQVATEELKAKIAADLMSDPAAMAAMKRLGIDVDAAVKDVGERQVDMLKSMKEQTNVWLLNPGGGGGDSGGDGGNGSTWTEGSILGSMDQETKDRLTAWSGGHFANGGYVGWGLPAGSPVPIVAHAGELVLNRKQQQAAGGRVVNVNGAIHIHGVQSLNGILAELETISQ